MTIPMLSSLDTSVKNAQVVADYQATKEREFVEELRRRYPVVIYKEALATVNKH